MSCPKEVLNSFINYLNRKGCTIVMEEYMSAEKFKDYYALFYSPDLIKLKYANKRNYRKHLSILIHEFGHYVLKHVGNSSDRCIKVRNEKEREAWVAGWKTVPRKFKVFRASYIKALKFCLKFQKVSPADIIDTIKLIGD